MERRDLKTIMREEYLKCASSPAYFMKNYVYIQHPKRGKIQFLLYPFQEKVLTLFQENPYSIVLKSRQLGISTLGAGYSLWLMLFHTDKNVLCIATKQDTAKNIVTKVKFMYDNLPTWLKEKDKPQEHNKLTLKLNNGSQIKATSASSDAGRSEAVSLLLIDEAAFIDNIGEIWASAQQTLATGGGCIALSTPYGTGNWFHKTWEGAEIGENSFLPIKLPWFVHPERDQSWRDQQDKDLGIKMAAQECDCDFTTSGDTVFLPEQIDLYEKTHAQDPIEKRGFDQALWVWKPVDYSKSYLVTADVARGDGSDYSTFHVLDLEANEQVAEYKGQIGTTDFGNLLVSIATEYNNAMLAPENANIGWSTIQTIISRGYTNLFYTPKNGEITVESYFSQYVDLSKMTPGFSMTTRNRPLAIGKLQEAIRDNGIIIRSKRTIAEMKVFIWKNGKAEAQSGYNDDLILPLSVAAYLRESSFMYKQHGIDMSKSLLNNIHSNRSSYQAAYTSNQNQNPWKMDNPYGSGPEDITWLL